MRVLSPIFALLVWLLVLAAGVALIAGAIYPQLLSSKVPNFLYNYGDQSSFRWTAGLVGVVLVVIVVLRVMFVTSRDERRTRFLSFSTAHGSTNISVETVESFLARAGATLPDVKRLATRVIPLEGKASPDVDVTAWVYHGRNVREVCSRIAQYIVDSTKDLLGVEEIGEVNVTIREIEPTPGEER